MEIIVDKRIELMAVIQTMTHYWDNLSFNFFNKKLFKCKYKDNVDNYFSKYKNHETVKLYGELCSNVQDISAFINLVLCYSNPPDFDNIANVQDNINCLIRQNIPYENFINRIKRFYEDTNFEYFFENNRNEYEMLLNDYINRNELKEYVNIVDMYLGNNTKNYTVVISALLMGNFGITLLTNENITYNYSIISPFDYREIKYVFGPKIFISELLWHEIGHLTINDMTKSYIDQFNISHKVISNDLTNNLYTNVEAIINEYIIRAITIRLLEINYRERTVEDFIKNHILKGFTEIESIKDYISKNCEKNNKFTGEEGYKELMDYVINKI